MNGENGENGEKVSKRPRSSQDERSSVLSAQNATSPFSLGTTPNLLTAITLRTAITILTTITTLTILTSLTTLTILTSLTTLTAPRAMRLLASLLLLTAAFTAIAQKPNPNLVQAGARGVFVFTGEQLMRASGPVTGIRIERRAGEQGEWKRVADLKPVEGPKDIQKGIEKAADALPYPIDLQGHRADSLWARLQRHGTREQLGAMNSNMAVLLAVGAAWCDTDAKPGTLYQYRITLAGAGNQLLSRFINPAERPAVDKLMPLYARYYEHQRALHTFWTATGGHRPAVLEVSRSMDKEPFAVIQPTVRVERRGADSVWYQVGDTTAIRSRVYRYVLKGWDLFGNPMPPCDTLYTASLDASQMPMPYDLHAAGDSTGRRVHVRWKLDNAPVVKQITLQRSTNSVDGFEPIAELSADRTSFVDEDVRPATSYFYRFALEHKATHVPMRGVSFAAVAYDQRPPQPASELAAVATDEGVVLTWLHPDRDVLGFHLYRAEENGPFQLASPRIPAGGEGAYTYLDTTRSLRGDRSYHYALRTVSTSHRESAFSDTASVMPLTNLPVPQAPRDLTARVDVEQAIVSWEDLSNDPLFHTYQVVRTRPGNRVDTLFRSTNFLIDTLDAGGKPTSYRVIAVNDRGRRSAPSPAVSAQARVAPPAAPNGLVARAAGGKVALTWEAPPGERIARYEVYRYTRGSEPVKAGSVPAGKPLRLEDAGAMRGQLNFYFVRSVAASGAESGPGREVGVELR